MLLQYDIHVLGTTSLSILVIAKMFILKTDMNRRHVAKVISNIKHGFPINKNIMFNRRSIFTDNNGHDLRLTFLAIGREANPAQLRDGCGCKNETN